MDIYNRIIKLSQEKIQPLVGELGGEWVWYIVFAVRCEIITMRCLMVSTEENLIAK